MICTMLNDVDPTFAKKSNGGNFFVIKVQSDLASTRKKFSAVFGSFGEGVFTWSDFQAKP